MALTTCEDCRHEVSTLAHACPQCGRPIAPVAPHRPLALELALVLAVFGLASLIYATAFPEHLAVDEARLKLWFGFQLVAIAAGFAGLGWWHRSRAASE
jgi:hypothetical protein